MEICLACGREMKKSICPTTGFVDWICNNCEDVNVRNTCKELFLCILNQYPNQNVNFVHEHKGVTIEFGYEE